MSGHVAESVDVWAGRVRPHLDRAAESIVAAGRELCAAKAALPHGSWLPLLEAVGVAPRTAQRMMQIAAHPVLGNATRGSHLPTSWRTLAELARLDEDVLLTAIESGDVHPGMRRADAERLVSETEMTADDAQALTVQVRELQFSLGEMFFDRLGPIIREHGTVPPESMDVFIALTNELEKAQNLTELLGEHWVIECALIVMAFSFRDDLVPDFTRPWSAQIDFLRDPVGVS